MSCLLPWPLTHLRSRCPCLRWLRCPAIIHSIAYITTRSHYCISTLCVLLYSVILLQQTGDLRFNLEWLDTCRHYHETERLKILRENWALQTLPYYRSPINTAAEYVTNRHCYISVHRQTLLQKCSPTDTATESVTDTLLHNCSPTDTATEMFADRHCYRHVHRRKLLQKCSPTDTATESVTDRHCYITVHQQTLLQECSPTDTVTEIFTDRHCYRNVHRETLLQYSSP